VWAPSAAPCCRWTTPLGLPVAQPYFERSTATVAALGHALHDPDPTERARPAAAKQASAFPPNFIHSIDATHMMLTARAASRRGIAFAGVHDSFWTHAADVDVLRDAIRSTFVALYRRPLLDALRADMQASLREVGSSAQLPPPPPQGDLDLDCVKTSTYFFN
jgi:DNA-directed RNA polymerase, mitochondrial